MNSRDFQNKIIKTTTPLPGSEASSVFYTMYVKKQFDGLPILEYLQKAIPSVSKDKWIEKITSGNLKVQSQTVDLNFIVKASWLVEHSSEPRIEPFVSTNIHLIYEDNDILVINKPAPLPMHTSGRFVKNTLENILKLAFPTQEYKLIHRLDANTTGIVVLGKNNISTSIIQKQFQDKKMEKVYLALVEGNIKEDFFNSEEYISSIKTKSGGRSVGVIGEKAFTEFEVLERYEKTTLLKVIPHTGKTNQIRLHLANLGYPIVGDLGYKNEDYFKNNPLTYPKDILCLHAWKLSFTHPTTMKIMDFEAKIPEKFSN